MKKLVALLLVTVICATFMSCAFAAKETIVIYSCANDKRIAHMTQALESQFPEYNFIVEYQGTGKLVAKLLAEGRNTDCDIIHDLAYLNLDSLNQEGFLADVSFVDTTAFVDDANVSNNYVAECRTGGAIVLNNDVMAARNLPIPTSYEDLLKPEYQGLISMPDPKSSGTGYMFLKSLVNAWGEEEAFDYFNKLSENILQFTSSGNGPMNALLQQEVAIALGMTVNAVTQLDEGVNLTILFFDEGSPFSMYGQSIVAGKEERPAVKEVFTWLVEEYLATNVMEFDLEKIFKDVDYTSPNYPADVVFSDMSNDTLEEKERLLEMWDIT